MRRGRPGLTFLLGVALAFGGIAHAWAEDALARAKASGVLSVGTTALGAPFDDIAAGRHVGFDADLLADIAAELGLGLHWIAPSRGAQVGGAAAENPDVTGPVALTAAVLRHGRVLPPMMDVSDALLKRKGDGALLKSADVAGKTVGGLAAAPSVLRLRAYAKTLPARITVRTHAEAADVYADLVMGRVAAIVGDLPTLAVTAKAHPDAVEVVQPPFGPRTFLGFVAARDADHAALADSVAAAILRIKADGRLAALQTKWFGMAVETPDAAPDPKP